MQGFDALRDLSERHGLRARNLHRRGEHGFGQRTRTTATMAGQQTTQALLLPQAGPVVDRLRADIQPGRGLGSTQSVAQQQQACGTCADVSMSMIHRHLLQGMPLDFAQLEDAFHRMVLELDSLLKRTNFKIVYPEHLAFGILSPFAVIFAREYGLERSLFGALLLIAGGVIVRSIGPAWCLYLGTAIIGAGIALG